MGSSRDWPGDEQRVAEWVRAMLRAPFDVEPEVLTVDGLDHAIVPNDARGLQGCEAEFEAEMLTSDIERLCVSLVQPMVESAGAKLTRAAVELSQGADHVVHLTAAARVTWKWLSGSARVRAAVRVTHDGRCTLLKLKIRSRNPLLALALLAARGQVKQAVGGELDLNQALAEQGLPLRVSHIAFAVRREARCRVKLEGLTRSG